MGSTFGSTEETNCRLLCPGRYTERVLFSVQYRLTITINLRSLNVSPNLKSRETGSREVINKMRTKGTGSLFVFSPNILRCYLTIH